ncbi:unnamed protein product [Adineta steineri]|uniref:LamG-like jellyroll fold domain-containing protein n=1 Tax=Adineta steineri TaxID=433720 RepID=A0A818WWZ6_9BILA|nr:unnamed protein product [Adineta steineri]CAF3731540.1 unnamed protein product [Adineta steineri]
MTRYITENYVEEVVAQFSVDNYSDDSTYYVNTIYEGSTNVILRHDAYDLVGNPLQSPVIMCFCSTDVCNIDFETCATGINYNSTTSTINGSTSSTTNAGTSSIPTVTTTPAGTTTNSSLTSQYMIAFYSFDGNALDLYSTYNGTLMGGATFTTAGYVRQALLLSSNTQYVQTSFINVAYQSFTISGWISTTSLMNASIFSQCSARVARKCLTLGILNRYLFMDFFGGFNTTGTTILNASKWFHVAFVYDQVAQQQLIYLNGIENGRSAVGSTPPYTGTCQSVKLGAPLIGAIDQLLVTNRAKAANEILTDATLVAAYSFNGNLLDSSPNGLNGSGSMSFSNSGRLGQALQFSNTSALFQSTGLTALKTLNQSFSISLWLKPQVTFSGSSVLVLSSTNWCMQLVGITSSGALVFKINGMSSSAQNISTTNWIHLAYTYSQINEARFFINGNLVGNLQALFTPANSSVTLNIGGRPSTNPSCTSSSITSGFYQGLVDELKIFSRELSSTDIIALANP